jgi:surface antigen
MQTGSYNVFAAHYGDQCTYWASQRYHALTGIWVPMTGNAYQWAGEASSAGWQVSSQPPKNVPSIICLQGNAGQGVESQYGHVAVVERVNADGSVYTSDYNWYPHIGDSTVVYVTFKPGQGVSFIWAGNNAGSIPVVSRVANTVTQGVTSAAQTFSLASNATIAQALSSFDNALTMSNPFIVENSTDTFSIGGGDINVFGYDTGIPMPEYSASITDPIKWIQGFGQNIINDLRALVLRIIFIALGVFVLYRVLDHYVNFTGMAQQAASTAQSIATTIAPLLA